MATDVSRTDMGAVGYRVSSTRKRVGPLPPLKNVLKMEARADDLAWTGTYMCLFVIVIVLLVMITGG